MSDTDQRETAAGEYMPFGRMVALCLRWTLAAFPSIILLNLLVIATVGVIGFLFGA